MPHMPKMIEGTAASRSVTKPRVEASRFEA